jgi:hypothetical protein
MHSEFSLLSGQKEFLLSESKKAFLLAGIGFGKSTIGSHFSINMFSKYPKSKGLITANTYSQLINATVENLVCELDACGIPHKLSLGGSKKHIKVGNTKAYLYSLEKPNTIRGIQTGWWWSDESAFAKKEAIQICRGRLRDKNGPLYERHTSSPNGFNWAYDEFENKDGINRTDKLHLIRGITKDNIFLPDGYYESLLEDYGGPDNPLAKQELFGQFTNLQEGAIYWAFDRDINVKKVEPNKEHIVYACQDFNVNNMEGCYFQYIDGQIRVFKESILKHHGANTDTAASTIKTDLVNKGYRVKVVPDSTGKAKKSSSSGVSDIEILKSYGLDVVDTENPFIRDRQNSTNIGFKKNKVVVDPSCKELIKEIETLSSRDKEGDKAHVSVALGYGVWHLMPLLPPRGKSRMIQL